MLLWAWKVVFDCYFEGANIAIYTTFEIHGVDTIGLISFLIIMTALTSRKLDKPSDYSKHTKIIRNSNWKQELVDDKFGDFLVSNLELFGNHQFY